MQWQWDGTLQDSEWFDVRVWKAGEPHYGIAWVRELEYQADFRGRAGGEYLWAVAVIRGRDGQMDGELSPESATRRFIYGGGGGGSSGGEEGDGGTSPTAPIVTPPG